MNLFELFVKIGVDDQASKGLSNITEKLGNGLKKAAQVGTAAVTAAAAGIAALTKAAVDNYAEYEQLVGGVETLFKDSADRLMEYADNAYKTAGLSANEYMSTVVSFSSALIRSLGGDTTQAAELANKAITDMSDNANKMGTSLESLQNAYTGFSRGNFTMLDNLALGFAGTQEGMQELLDTAKELSGVEYDISSYADIIEAIHVVQTEMGITGTTALEASETIAGSVASMKSAWHNLITAFADENQDLGALVDKFVSSFDTALDNLLPRIEVALGGLSTFIGKIAPLVIERLPELTATILEGLLTNASDIFMAISDVLPDLISTLIPVIVEQTPKLILAGIELTKGLISGLLQAIIDPEVVSSLLTLVKEIATIMINRKIEMVKAAVEFISTLASGLLDNIDEIIPKIKEFVSGIVNFIVDNASAFIESAKTIISTIGEGIVENAQNMIGDIKEFIEKIVDFIAENVPLLIDGAVSIAQGIANFIVEKADVIIPHVKEFIGKIGDFLKTNVPLLLDAALNIIGSIGQYIAENAEEIVSGINDFMSRVVKFFTNTENLKQLAVAAVEIIVGLVTGIVTNAAQMLPAMVALIAELVVALTDPKVLTQITTLASDIVVGLTNTIISILSNTEIISSMIDAAGEILLSFVEAITTSLPIILDAAVKIIVNLVSFLTNEENIDRIYQSAVDIVSALAIFLLDPSNALVLVQAGADMLWNILKGLTKLDKTVSDTINQWCADLIISIFTTDWIQVGKDLVSSIWDGMKQMWTTVSDWFTNKINGIVEGYENAVYYIKSLLGLVDPSSGSKANAPTLPKQYTTSEPATVSDYQREKYRVQITQNIYSQAQTAADLAEETQYEASRAWIASIP